MGLSRTFIFTVVICQLMGYGLGQEVNLLSFGDFMEFHIGLYKSCENARGAPNTTWEIINTFTQCTRALESPQDKDLFDVHMSICKNRGKYFQCYDKLRSEVTAKCGSDKGPMLPAVYRATAANVCGNDNGAAKLGELKRASSVEPPRNADKLCPPETGKHWIELCQELLPTFHSSDLCARQAAITTCLKRMTCDAIPVGKLTTKLYADGRAHLQCRN